MRLGVMLALLSAAALSGCGGDAIDVQPMECEGAAGCEFVGREQALEVLSSVDAEGDGWNGWFPFVRLALHEGGVDDWNPCDGDVLTASWWHPGEWIPPIRLTVTQWVDDVPACVGVVWIDDFDIPFIPLNGVPLPGAMVEVAVPDEGASMRLRPDEPVTEA